MPEIYNSEELDGILNIKRRMTKNLKKTFADEEPFGLIVGDAKSLDNLVAATEEIETNAELVVAKLDKRLNVFAGPRLLESSADKQLNAFYRSVRKGLNIVKNLKFAGLPRSDIEKLSNYLPSLEQYSDRFKELFDSRIDVTFNTDEALKNIEEEKKRLNNEFANLTRQESQGNDVVDKLRQNEIDMTELMRTKNTRLDYKMIMKEFTNFIQLLQDGIASFNAGRTTQGNLGGSYIGGAEYQPRRFM